LEPREEDGDSGGTGSGVASGGIVSIAEETNNFIVDGRFGDIIGSDDGSSDIVRADTFESSVGDVGQLRSDTEVLFGVEESASTSGG